MPGEWHAWPPELTAALRVNDDIDQPGTQYQQADDDAGGGTMGCGKDAFDFTAMEAGAEGTETRTGFQQGMQVTQQIQQVAQGANGRVDSTAGDLAGALSGPAGDAGSAVDGRYSFVFDGNADTSGGHTYFDGKFLTAHDLTREQVSLSGTGFDLV